jgi:succinoglycan biosynthesis transport protein ExoP
VVNKTSPAFVVTLINVAATTIVSHCRVTHVRHGVGAKRGDMRSDGSDPDRGMVQDAELDASGIARGLWHNRWWVIGSTLTVAVLTLVVVNLVPPKFRSEARVLIDGHENVFLRPEAEKIDRGSEVVDQEAVTSQVQLALSRDLARQVTSKLKLGDHPEFDPARRRGSWMVSTLRRTGLVKDPLSMAPDERVLENYYDHLTVYQVDKSRVIAIEFQSGDPDLAASVANAVADAYVQRLRAVEQEQTRAAGLWLAGEIEDLRRKVANAEERVEAFRAKSKRFVGLNNTPLSNQLLADLNSQVAAARSRKADAEAKARFASEALRLGKPVESPDFLNSDLIKRLSERRATLRSQLAEQSTTLLDGHPRIKELRAQILDLEHEIRKEAERLTRSLENDAEIAASRVETLSSDLEQLEQQAALSNEQDVELRALEREAKAERDLLESYLAKYRETAARDNLAGAPAEARVISQATISNTPYFPRKAPIVLITTLATFVVITVLIATRELLIGSRYRPMVVETATEAAVLITPPFGGTVELPMATEQGVTLAADPGLAGEFPDPVRSLVDIVDALAGTSRRGCRVIVVGSARSVGTTRCAVELARLLSAGGRVVLVDLALVAPGLSAWAVDAGSPGITQLVRGTASIGQAITRDRGSDVHIVPAGRVDGEEAEAVLRSDRLRMALDAMAYAYDYLVMDVGDAAETTLKRVVNRASVGVLVVTPGSKSHAAFVHSRLMRAGLADVMIVQGRQPQSETAYSGTRVAAA